VTLGGGTRRFGTVDRTSFRTILLLGLIGVSIAGLVAATRRAPPIGEVSDGAILEIYALQARVGFAVDDDWPAMFGEAFEVNGREDASLTIAGSPRAPVLLVTRGQGGYSSATAARGRPQFAR